MYPIELKACLSPNFDMDVHGSIIDNSQKLKDEESSNVYKVMSGYTKWYISIQWNTTQS